MVVIVMLYPAVYSFDFLVTALVVFGAPIGVTAALFVTLVKWLRCGRGSTAFVTFAVFSTVTVLVSFLPSLSSNDNPHVLTRFMWSIFVSLPVIFGIGVASLFGYLYEERRTQEHQA